VSEERTRRLADWSSLLGSLGLVAVLFVIGALGVWSTGQRAPAEPSGSDSPRVVRLAVPASAPPPEGRPTLDYASDGLPIKPADPDAAVPEGPMHPHPHTEAHERIYRENNLLGLLNGAMDVKDPKALREFLEAYRREYPEDPHALQEGYEVIADCLDHPGETSRARARKYYDEKTASTLRRYVRRHCFES
jgi:hypothetical protein